MTSFWLRFLGPAGAVRDQTASGSKVDDLFDAHLVLAEHDRCGPHLPVTGRGCRRTSRSCRSPHSGPHGAEGTELSSADGQAPKSSAPLQASGAGSGSGSGQADHHVRSRVTPRPPPLHPPVPPSSACGPPSGADPDVPRLGLGMLTILANALSVAARKRPQHTYLLIVLALSPPSYRPHPLPLNPPSARSPARVPEPRPNPA